MSTAAVSSSSIYQELQSYFQQRRSDLQQLGQDIQSGDLADAQQEYSAIQTLGQSGPFANGDAFKLSNREQDFNAIGQALQSGDLAGAQQALTQLENTFQRSGNGSTPVSSSGSSSAPSGQEIILNLGNAGTGSEQSVNPTS